RDWAALSAGRALPDLPASYPDFVRWQRRLLDSPAGERLERYWLDRLAGAPLVLDLPTDRPRPRVAAHAGALARLRLGSGLAGRVRALARAHGATLYTTLLAAFEVLLGRLTGQDDLLVGSPATARRDAAFDGVVGYFVNPVVLRADLTGKPTFAAHLERTGRTVAAALAHRDLPFPLLARRLQPVRDAGRPPVFQALFVFQSAAPGQEPGLAGFAVGQAGARVELEGLALESLPLDPGTAQLDLTLAAAEVGEALVFSCEHDTALFDGVTMGRWLGHLETLLAAAAARPETRLGDLPLLGAGERQQLLVEWSDTAVFPAREAACLHELFEAQARRTPEAVALVDGTREVRYRELDEEAERLAARLRSCGAGPEVVVGVRLDRSAGLVAALLAILKAGAAYLPLDPRQPRPRLAAMLESARAGLVLSTGSLAAELPWSGPLVLVEGDSGGAGSGRLVRRALPENLAYVLFTSGSTGTPKGVAVSHRSAVELVRWAGGVFSREELSGVLAATSLSFDLSVFELFGPLSSGGTAVLAEDVLELPALPARGRVTLVNTVPSAMAELVHAGSLGASIRTVNLAGEPLPRALAERLYATGTVERVWNLYGPSEDTTYSTASLVGREDRAAPAIGRPISSTKAWVLAQGGEPRPVGLAGELVLGGAGLARGYLHRPDLTAERFVPDPWPEEAGARDDPAGGLGGRLYRTGDLVRWRPDGSLEFLGRLDHQVKIRGFRIELGEIEATLSALPGVREAVVLAQEERAGGAGGEGGGRRLVAYVAGDVAPDVLRRSLRDQLRERLPDAMVPSTFVALAALPRTPSGKVDRRALPAPEPQRAEESSPAPRTPVEELLAGLWAEVLGSGRLGVADHFFALGGHSLLGTRVLSRLRAVFGVEMPLSALFEAPVLADFAARVERALLERHRGGASHPAPPLVPVPREGPLPLSHAQQRLWLAAQLAPDDPLYNMSGTLRVAGPLDGAVLALCLGEIVRRHEALRTVFAVRDGVPVQVIRPAAPFPLPLIDLAGLPESAREGQALALADAQAVRPFDLARGPLLHGGLLRLAEDDHLLALTLHHIVSDGWSLGILLREVTALYPAFADGKASPLPELPVQYGDFSVWQRSWLQGETLENEVSYWRRQLAGLPSRLELPTDRPRPAVQRFRGASRPVRLPADLVGQAEALGRSAGATLFMVLLASFEALLARLSGQEDLAVGSPVAGRNRVECEDLIGFFVNTLVLRGDLAGRPSMRALLGRVRETALAAYLHQEVPFEKLVEDLAPARSLAYSPLFQVLFALQGAAVERAEMRGLRLRMEGGAGTTAKFDLTLVLAGCDGGMLGFMKYASDLFDGATIGRLLVHFERLLAAALAAPDRPWADLPLLSEAELHQLRIEWNSADAAPEASLVETFESWVDRTPDATALLAPGEAASYAELDRRANRLAHRLRALGVTVDSRVGLCAERSPAMIVAVLGILKAGAAYVPLDPAYPKERLAFMVEDARIPLLLAEERLLGSLPETAAATVLLDTDAPWSGRERRLPSLATPDSAAYVIYTSGSTGQPKGVMIHHRGWSNLARAQRHLLHVRPGDRVLQFASLSFDASASEIAMALCSGATLVLGPRERQLSGQDLTALVGTSTIVTLPPTLLATLEPEELPGLETLIVAGEACPLELVRRWSPGRQLVNGYGPTEVTIGAAMKIYDGGERLPIGRPLAGMQVHVLDAGGNLLPVGVAGELCVGGVGLARG
ncbi:MAG TPA: amino acid adenylation domain-containing protein, partial [Thermoanaerobaculia bacterium]|nr:amino acid adenylation domain-containing protein [Thermoanaerobaculia bacterium]